jgi:DnaA-homolog protein
MRQIPLAINIEAPHTFDNFVPGANVPVIAHLQALAPNAAPVYLWGPSGAGKTHLLQAVVHRLHRQGQRAGWFSAADPAPWAFDEAWALVVIDGCDPLDPGQQHAAFAVFVDATTHGVPLVAAGTVPPVDLPLREDLRTRLGWGHVFAVQPLGEAESRATLRQVADRRGIFLSDEVMDYLLTRFERDLKHLIALLDRLDEFSLATKRPITVPLLKQMLAEEGP